MKLICTLLLVLAAGAAEARDTLDLSGAWRFTPLAAYAPERTADDFEAEIAGRWHPQGDGIPYAGTRVPRGKGHALRVAFGPHPGDQPGWAQAFRWADLASPTPFRAVRLDLRREGATPPGFRLPLYLEGTSADGKALKITLPLPPATTEWQSVTVPIPEARPTAIRKISFLVGGALPRVTLEVDNLRFLAEEPPRLEEVDFDGPGEAPPVRLAPAGEPGPLAVPGAWNGADAPEAWRSARYGRYTRRFRVPEAWREGKVRVRFNAVNMACVVRCNGRVVGRHVGATLPFTCDLTPHVRPGEENELVVDVADPSWATTERTPADVYEGGPPAEVPVLRCPPARNARPRHGIWQEVRLERLPLLSLANVRITPSVRRQTVQVAATVTNAGDTPCRTRVRAAVLEGNREVLALESPLFPIAPGAEVPVTLSRVWERPRLWRPEDPHLYQARVELLAEGGPADALSIAFGFREVWVEGNDFYLNGERVPLYGTSIDEPAATRERYAELYTLFRSVGMNVVRLHGEPHAPLTYEVADEMGMMLINESELYGSGLNRSFRYGHPEFDRAVKESFAAWVERDFHHPSVVAYSVENECIAAWSYPNRIRIEKALAEYGRALKRLDPTRPIYFSADGDPGGEGVADWLCTHYPGQNHVPLEMQGDLVRNKPGRPTMIGEYGFLDHSKASATRWAGEAAFEHPRAYQDLWAAFYTETIEGFRRHRIAGILPFAWHGIVPPPGSKMAASETPTGRALCRAFAPVLLSVIDAGGAAGERVSAANDDERIPGGPAGAGYEPNRQVTRCAHFLEGAPVSKEAWVCSDLHARLSADVRWHVPGTPLRGTGRVRVPADGGVGRAAIRFAAPTPGAYELVVECVGGGKVLSTSRQPFRVYPRSFVAAPSLARPVALYDPPGRTAEALTRAGIAFERVTSAAALPPRAPGVLVIGAGALDDAVAGRRAEIADWVAAGGVVVQCEQESDDRLSPLGLRRTDVAQGFAWIHSPGHPLFAGLEGVEISRWGTRPEVSRFPFRKPASGAFVTHAGAYYDRWEGFPATPLVEVFHGRGRYLLSQLTLVGHYGENPVATRLLHNLLWYADRSEAPPLSPVFLLEGGDALTREALARIGVEATLVSPDAVAQTPPGVLVLPRGADLPALATRREEVLRWVGDGGRILCLPQAAAGWDAAWLPEPARMAGGYASGTHFRARQDPLLHGISLADIGAGDVWDRRAYCRDPFNEWGPGWEALWWAGPALTGDMGRDWDTGRGDDRHASLLRLRHGKGVILLCQALLDRPEGEGGFQTRGTDRALATLLTHLRGWAEAPAAGARR